MKTAAFALLLFFYLGPADAETCTVRTEPANGALHTYETCDAVVEELFRQEIDGFRHTAYAVHYKGARVIVDDVLNRTDHTVGEQVTFLVMKTDLSERSIRSLAFTVFELRKEDAECP
jgi:hypothetical protein